MSESAAVAVRHLLVVDDDAAVADVMRMGLEADGTCRVTIAPGATEALAAIEHDPPHAAIIDAVLPRVPGLVLARTVIDLGVPVLIVSGDPTLQKGLAEAGCPFLLKPFHLSQLAAETRMLLDTATARKIEVARALDRMLAAKEELAEVSEQTRRLVEESRRFREEVAVRYRVHFLDHGNGVIDAVQLESGTDERAILEAHRIAIPSIGAGFDVWHGARLVYRHRR